jgi:hypothetical protein
MGIIIDFETLEFVSQFPKKEDWVIDDNDEYVSYAVQETCECNGILVLHRVLTHPEAVIAYVAKCRACGEIADMILKED